MLFVRTIALFESTCLPSTSSALRSQIERGQPVASVTQRDQDFGVYYGQQRGFNQDVLLRIQLEGVSGFTSIKIALSARTGARWRTVSSRSR
jgi:hypothetical protein